MQNSLISNSNPDLLTLEEAATLVGKTTHNIRDYIQRGRIAKYNSLGESITRAANGDLRVSKTELQTFMSYKGQFYTYSFRRICGEREDNFKSEVFAIDEKQACLLIYAEVSESNAATREHAIEQASEKISKAIGLSWTTKDFLDADLEIWPDSSTCCTIQDIVER